MYPFIGGRKKEKEINFADIDPIYEVGDDLIVFKSGDIGYLFEVSLPEMESMEGEAYENIAVQFMSALKSLPVGTVLQKLDIYYNVINSKLISFDATGRIGKKIEEKFADDLVLQHKCILSVSFAKNPYDVHAVSTFFSMRKSPFKSPFEDIGTRILESEKVVYSLVGALNSIPGIALRRLEKEEIRNIYFQYLNLSFDTKKTETERNMFNDKNCFVIGEKKLNIITMSGQAEVISPYSFNHYNVVSPFIYPLTHYLNYPHILSQTIKIRNTDKELENLDKELKFNQALGGLAKQSNDIKREQIEMFTADIRASGKQLLSLSVQVMVYDSSDDRRENRVKDVINIFPMLNNASAKVESMDTANMFFAMMPGNMNQGYRWLTVPSDVASCYFAWTTTYASDRVGDYICDRFGNLLKVNLFNTDLNNQNSVTIGPSGAGKSFTIGHFMVQRFERKNLQIIIDVGGTYKRLVEALQGKYYEYNVERPLRFNPFLIGKTKEGLYDFNDDKKNFLVSLIITIWKSETDAVTKEEITILTGWLELYYEIVNNWNKQENNIIKKIPMLKDFMTWITEYDSEQEEQNNKEHLTHRKYIDLNSIKLTTKQFVEGSFKEILNYDKVEDISTYEMICFDLIKVKADPAIFKVVAMIITELSLDQIRLFPDKIKYLYMDEAWSLLSGMGDWIESMFRTIRKNNGSINIITQGIDEIVDSKIGNAILNNTETKIILNHQGKGENVFEKLRIHLGLTDLDMQKLKSIRVHQNYREIFIKQQSTSKIFCLDVPLYEHAVLTSKPSERNYLQSLFEKYKNMNYALDQWEETYKNK